MQHHRNRLKREDRARYARAAWRVPRVELLEDRSLLAAIPAPNGLVAWWTGEGNAFDSVGAHNGILEGGTTFGAGMVGQAFSLDGIDDRIRVPNSAALNPTAGFTIEAWIKSNSTAGARDIVSKWSDSTEDWSYIFKDHNNSDKLRIELSKGSHNDLADLSGNTSIVVGQWMHVAMTYDTSTVRLYYNGVLDGSQAVDPTHFIHASAADLLIGAVNPGSDTSEFFSGLIDEVSLYSRALSGSEIHSIFQAGSDGKQKTSEMEVIGSNPAAKSILAAPPMDFAIDFSEPYDPASIQAADFKVNGLPADSFAATDAKTVTFRFNNTPVAMTGSQSMAIGAGTVTSTIAGIVAPVTAWSASFEFQPPALTVVGSYPGPEAVVRTPPVDFRVDFSLPYDVASTQASDLAVNGVKADSLVLTDADTITFHFNASPVVTPGTQTVEIAGGAITSTTGGFSVALTPWATTLWFVPATGPIPTPSGLVAWWPGDGTAADFAGTNNGILEGGAGLAPGAVGQAFSLDGIDDRIRVANSAALNPPAGFTIEAWVRPSAIENGVIVAKRNDQIGDLSYIFKYTGGRLRAELWNGSNYLADIFSDSLFHDDWHHVALTVDTSTVRLYLDGVLDGFQAISQTDVVFSGSADLVIGGADDGDGGIVEGFGGLIDEVKLYGHALSAAEIQGAYGVAGSDAVVVDNSYTVPNGNTFVSPNSVLDNDVGAFRAVLVDPPQHGHVTLNRDGTFAYTPDRNFFSNDSFTYRASEFGSGIATVSIKVTLPTAIELPPGAVAWWSAEGNGNDSIGAHNGTLRGSTSIGPGKVGQAFDFHGGDGAIADYVEVPDSTAWPVGAKDFTIDMWVNLRSFNSGDVNPLVGQSEFPGGFFSGQGNAWALLVEGFTDIDGIIRGQLDFHFHGEGIEGSGIFVTADFSPTLHTWYNLAVSRSGAVYTFLVNGVVIGMVDDPTEIRDVAAPLAIGNSIAGQYPGGLDGFVDELVFFNRPLSPTEVQSIYNAASAGLVVRVDAEDGAQSIDGVAQQLFASVPPGGSPTLSFTTAADNSALFTVPPSIDSTGRLTFTPAPNSQGTTTVAVVKSTNAASGEGEESSSEETADFTIEIDQKAPWQNDIDPNDADNDGSVAPSDVVLIIDYINGFGPGPIPNGSAEGPFPDPTGDNFIAPNDALAVIDFINSNEGGIEDGEQAGGQESGGGGQGPGASGQWPVASSQGPGVGGQESVVSAQQDLFALLAGDVASQPGARRRGV